MEDFIVTRGSALKSTAAKDYITVNYEAPKKKRNSQNVPNKEEETSDKQNKIIDIKKQQEKEMKRARYDVIKFGMTGFKKDEAKEAKVALAISLGAKPPKKENVNYKVLLYKKQKEKMLAKKEEVKCNLVKSTVKHKSQKPFKKGKDGILGVYGKVDKKVIERRKK